MGFVDELNYDLLVIGSDTVLQMLNFSNEQGNLPIYWLPKHIKARKIIYGSSVGTLTADALSISQKEQVKESLSGYDFVGLRDEIAINLIENVDPSSKSKINFVPDSTFTYKIDYSPADKLAKRLNLVGDSKLLALNCPASFDITKYLVKKFKEKGYKVVTFLHNPDADLVLSHLSPFEWAGIYKYFKFVITDRFHGTVFSLKNQVPVLSIDISNSRITDSGLSKSSCLAKQFGLDKMYMNCVDIKDYSLVFERCEELLSIHDKQEISSKCIEMADKYSSFIDVLKDQLLDYSNN